MRHTLFGFFLFIGSAQIYAMNKSTISGEVLELNVGGHICTLSRSMIINHGGPYLNKLLNIPESKLILDGQGRLFIQLHRGDGELFEYFMYTEKLPEKFDFDSAERAEKLFQIPALKACIDRAPHPQLVKKWRAKMINYREKKWRGEKLDDADAIAIAHVLKSNKELQCLSLQNNDITDIGAAALLDMLSVNKKLKRLCLCGNKISKEGENNLMKGVNYKENFFLCLTSPDTSDESVSEYDSQ